VLPPSGAGPEVAPAERRAVRLGADPLGGGQQATAEQFDVEDVPAVAALLGGEQIEEQGGKSGSVERPGHGLVPRAVPAAPAAVGEEHDPLGPGGDVEMPLQRSTIQADDDLPFRGPAGGVGTLDAATVAEQRCDLIVRRLLEVVVPEADGHEARRGDQAHHLVGLVLQLHDRLRWCHRHGEDDAAGTLGPGHLHRGTRRPAGGQAVVDDHNATVRPAIGRGGRSPR